MTESELSRPVRIDSLPASGKALRIEASENERAALARRFDLPAIGRLESDVSIVRRGEGAVASGTLEAEVTQSCVVTGEPVDASVREAFSVEFRPTPDATAEEEIELSEAELDIVFFEGSAIDVGEAVAETLSLSLDPYPRCAGAEEALRLAGVKSEEEAGPFGALASLRDKLKPTGEA